jgi:hypothetical protein
MDIPFQDPECERAPEGMHTRVRCKHFCNMVDSAELAEIKDPAPGSFLSGQNGITRGV